MISPKLMKRTFLIGPVLAALLGAGVVLGCTGDTGIVDGRDSAGSAVATQEISGRGGGESGGEHGPGGEGGSESGSEGGASGSEEDSGATLALDETFDAVRGTRLILNYDGAGNAFTGTVENTTNNVLSNVRIEVHLSNGTEFGPTTPVDMAPGEVLRVNLPATAASFTGWIAHAEVGGGEGSQPGWLKRAASTVAASLAASMAAVGSPAANAGEAARVSRPF